MTHRGPIERNKSGRRILLSVEIAQLWRVQENIKGEMFAGVYRQEKRFGDSVGFAFSACTAGWTQTTGDGSFCGDGSRRETDEYTRYELLAPDGELQDYYE